LKGSRFIEGVDREQSTLSPECLDDWIDDSNPVRAVDVFVDGLNLVELGFDGVVPEAAGRPSYHPSALLKLYIHGDLNRVQSSRRLEREARRNLQVIWLLLGTRWLTNTPHFKLKRRKLFFYILDTYRTGSSDGQRVYVRSVD
jgi:transposase